MKKFYFFAAFVACTLCCFSCNKDIDFVDDCSNDGLLVFTATRDYNEGVKASLPSNVIKWSIGDEIDVFDGETTETVTLTADDIIDDGATAVIKASKLKSGVSSYYAAFPHENVEAISIGSATFKVGTYTTSSAIECVSETSTKSFVFHNVNNIIKIKTGIEGASYVTLVGNNSEQGSSSVVCSTASGAVSSVSGSADLNVRSVLRDSVVLIPIKPGIEFSTGFTIKVFASDSIMLASFTYTNPFSSRRNMLTTINNFDQRTNEAYFDNNGVYQGQGAIIDGTTWSPVYILPAVSWAAFNDGTEDKPNKSSQDPCPSGWRVPTLSETQDLTNGGHSDWVTVSGVKGKWFCGTSEYSEHTIHKVFLAETYCSYRATDPTYHYYWGNYSSNGIYFWTSKKYEDGGFEYAYCLYEGVINVVHYLGGKTGSHGTHEKFNYQMPIRCVLE